MTTREQFDNSANHEADVLVDTHPGKGPLGGIYTGLAASRSPHSIVVACDMPFLNARLLKYMTGLSCESDAVVPRLSEGRLEPLHAVYSKACLTAIEAQLRQPRIEAYSFLQAVCTRYLTQEECRTFDPELLSFFNINHQADLDQAVVLAAKSRTLF